MPILLTTPFSPGDLDPGHTYPRAKIVEVHQWLNPGPGGTSGPAAISVDVDFGDLVGAVPGTWAVGIASSRKRFLPTTEEYATMQQAVTTEGEGHKIYDGLKRVLYQWLIDKGYLAGTIEP